MTIAARQTADDLLAQWEKQLRDPSTVEQIALAVKYGKTAQVVLYVNDKGQPGRVKVTTS